MNSSRKKLIEVALPLEAINAAAAREESIRHGHPSTLHLWWARRPLAWALQRIAASVWDVSTSSPWVVGEMYGCCSPSVSTGTSATITQFYCTELCP